MARGDGFLFRPLLDHVLVVDTVGLEAVTQAGLGSLEANSPLTKPSAHSHPAPYSSWPQKQKITPPQPWEGLRGQGGPSRHQQHLV